MSRYLAKDEEEILGVYRQLNDENRAAAIELSKALLYPDRIDNEVIRCNSFKERNVAKIIPFPVTPPVGETAPLSEDIQAQIDDFLWEMGYIN
jgi:hypothetical protein